MISRRPPQEPQDPASWSEHMIASALATQTFQRKAIVITPNCNWTGYECDLLVVEQNLRIIDVEIKISRSDLKADAKKDKWWAHYGKNEETGRYEVYDPPLKREWPIKVWKHYYAIPREVWDDALLNSLPSPNSGVIALEWRRGQLDATVVRKATPNRDATVLTAAQAVNIARLTNLRYWNVRENLHRAQQIIADLRLAPPVQ